MSARAWALRLPGTRAGVMAGLALVAEAERGEGAIRLYAEHSPDVLLTDIEMPGLTGLDLAVRLQEAQSPTRVVILTTFGRAGYLRRALDAGVRGYLLKDAPSEQLASALRQVMRGVRVIDPQLAVAAWGEEDPLTERERAVLRLAGEGATSAQIAERLHLSQGTVRNYLSEAIGKLGAANRIEAFRTARHKGWL